MTDVTSVSTVNWFDVISSSTDTLYWMTIPFVSRGGANITMIAVLNSGVNLMTVGGPGTVYNATGAIPLKSCK